MQRCLCDLGDVTARGCSSPGSSPRPAARSDQPGLHGEPKQSDMRPSLHPILTRALAAVTVLLGAVSVASDVIRTGPSGFGWN